MWGWFGAYVEARLCELSGQLTLSGGSEILVLLQRKERVAAIVDALQQLNDGILIFLFTFIC